MEKDKKKYQNRLETIDIGYLIFCIIFHYRKYQTVLEIAGTFNSVTCNQIHRLYFICISVLQHVLWITMILLQFLKKIYSYLKYIYFSIQKHCISKASKNSFLDKNEYNQNQNGLWHFIFLEKQNREHI